MGAWGGWMRPRASAGLANLVSWMAGHWRAVGQAAAFALQLDGAEARSEDRRTKEAFARQILPHLDSAYTLAAYLSGNATVADDLTQEAFLKAYRAFPTFRGGDARAWVLAIVRNGWRDWCVRERLSRARFMSLEVAGDDDMPDAAAIEAVVDDLMTAEQALLRREEDERVRTIIARLPDAQREILILREIEDLSYREVAEIIGAPVGTVMSRLARARETFALLWQRIEESGP